MKLLHYCTVVNAQSLGALLGQDKVSLQLVGTGEFLAGKVTAYRTGWPSVGVSTC